MGNFKEEPGDWTAIYISSFIDILSPKFGKHWGSSETIAPGVRTGYSLIIVILRFSIMRLGQSFCYYLFQPFLQVVQLTLKWIHFENFSSVLKLVPVAFVTLAEPVFKKSIQSRPRPLPMIFDINVVRKNSDKTLEWNGNVKGPEKRGFKLVMITHSSSLSIQVTTIRRRKQIEERGESHESQSMKQPDWKLTLAAAFGIRFRWTTLTLQHPGHSAERTRPWHQPIKITWYTWRFPINSHDSQVVEIQNSKWHFLSK